MNRPSLRRDRLKFQELRKSTVRFGGTYGIFLRSIKKYQNFTTCNWLDLEILGNKTEYALNPPQTLLRAGV